MRELILKREIVVNKILCRLLGVGIFLILSCLGAFVRIPLPFTPVPITLQTFFVLLSGAFLGSKLGFLTQLSYIFLGIWGLPIFTGAGSGLLYLLGPTGGYLLGFVLAAFLIGSFIKFSDNLLFTFALFCLGDAVLLFCGTLWLKFLFGYDLTRALFIGFLPFIPGDLLKITAASVIYGRLRSRLKEIF
ncbi:MAG: biotin transporter BioY [Candidatus Omnitrophica bacterium]|nr:biotin transporter BioY [Candidatus Omnitrophota bacterium]MDD5592179.1 biotin transporter BioY [Candidatus Omnitrophota bacterium]